MIFPYQGLLDLLCIAVALSMQWRLVLWLPEVLGARHRARMERPLRRIWWLSAAWSAASVVYGFLVEWYEVPANPWLDWCRGLSLLWLFCSGILFAAVFVARRAPAFDPGRRRILAGALLAAPAAVASHGLLVERSRFRVTEVDLSFSGLPGGLDGVRIAHLSDIHLGPFLEDRELRRVVAMANELRPQLTVVTGDLITERDDRLSDCLSILKDLRADAGVFGCLGNHENSARCEDRARREGASLGLEFLRQEARDLRFGDAVLRVAGVDYQFREKPYLVGANTLLAEGRFNLLLCHNPDVFPVSARQGWRLTLAGHTHGGQITAGVLQRQLNLARLFTPYVYGAYRKGGAAIFVTRGIGTVGVPARVGAPPEVALIRLCAT